MRLLILCKRRPQGRDLLKRPYGRFFYLPYYLAKHGHQVTLLLLDYRNGDQIHEYAYGMEWFSVSLWPSGSVSNYKSYFTLANELINKQKPDWIIGFSDSWYGILACYLGSRYRVETLIDAYDNYESYIPWLKPLHWVWRYSLRRASTLASAGPQLAELMSSGRRDRLATVIPMAADPIYYPINDSNLRERFSLPEGAPLVGYCGSLYRNRGVEALFDAMRLLLNKLPDAKLVISGRHEKGLDIPGSIQKAVIHLGYLPDEQIPFLINAIDVLLVLNLKSSFGNYSYPVKLYEAMSCHKPIVASDTASTNWILRNHPECLVNIDNPENIANRIREALLWKTKEYTPNCSWNYSASILRDLLETPHSTAMVD